jgi:hydroxyacylglutathione hydrolase
MLPLEDNFSDVIGKAMRGLELSESAVATRAGLTPADVQSLRQGQWNADAARKVAPVLGLGADALAALGAGKYRPAPVAIDGLRQFTTPFDDLTVNSYIVWDAETREAAAFDTGSDCTGMLEFLSANQLNLILILLTHTHGDHIFDLDRLKEKTGAEAVVSSREPLEGAKPFAEQITFEIGALQGDTRLTWGHSRGGITYVISGLAKPVAIVGDSVFAGSMGGGGVSYADALRTNREQILTLADETILCPGHGPMTTVGEERRNNPFFA